MLLCLTPVTAVLVIGWLARSMQRSTFKYWYRASGTDLGAGEFVEFVQDHHGTAHLAHWPNWLIGHEIDDEGHVSGILSRWLGSLWANLSYGLRMLLNTWVLPLPACVIWIMAWWGGWENSFNKGYEQAAVGPVAGLAGVGLFLVAMLYVPMAQARQAATGNWRAFYDFRLIRTLTRQCRWLTVWLAVLFALAGLVMAGLHTGPLAAGNMLDGAADWSEERMEQLAGLYHRVAGAIVFVLVVVLRTVAARIYAKALSRGVRTGAIEPDQLADNERAFFARLGLLAVDESPAGGIARRVALSSGRGIAGVMTVALLLALWFGFAAQIFVAQFLNHNWISWLNLPLIQIPWFYGP